MNKPDFDSNFFKNNRANLRRHLNTDDPIVITANGLIQMGADSSYPFVQDANFWYLSGINDPDIILVMDGEREFLIAPTREATRATFDGQIDQTSLTNLSGIGDVLNEVSGWKRLDALAEKTKRLATLAPAPSFIEQYGMYANPARSRLIDRIRRHVEDIHLMDIRPEIARLRMIKQAPELAALKLAIDITTDTLKDVMAAASGYSYEYEIEADISRGFRYRGADGHAFDPIVAGGKRACTLHNTSNNAALDSSELVVMDVGAAVMGYAADITRTMSVSKPSPRQQDVFRAVRAAHAYAMSLIKPGTKLKTYEDKVMRFIGSELKTLGLIKNLKETEVRRYFPHATSHFIGLNVHDVGDYQMPLKPGMVLTVEPGIYIPEEGIGVRIEDDVLVTPDGVKSLSAGLPVKL